MLKRTAYDTHHAATRIRASGMPGAADFVRTYVETTPSEAEALASHRAIMLRQQRDQAFG